MGKKPVGGIDMTRIFSILYSIAFIICIVFFVKSIKERKKGKDNTQSKKIAVGNLAAFFIFFILTGFGNTKQEEKTDNHTVEVQSIEVSSDEVAREITEEVTGDNRVSEVDRGMVVDDPMPDSDSVEASDNSTISLESITFSETEMTLEPGENVRLTLSYLPEGATEKETEWVSSDESILTVDSEGNVNAIQAGVATITATTENGLTAECVITVDGSTRVMRISVSRKREDNENIGDEWSYVNEVNGEAVSSGDYVLSVGDTLVFHSKYTESDTCPDVGEASMTHTVTAEDLANGFTVTLNVTVTENGGRNSGKSARFTVTYKITVG